MAIEIYHLNTPLKYSSGAMIKPYRAHYKLIGFEPEKSPRTIARMINPVVKILDPVVKTMDLAVKIKAKKSISKVDVSVVIRAYNSEKTLSIILGRLKSQTGTDEIQWEIIVVDNNSADRVSRRR